MRGETPVNYFSNLANYFRSLLRAFLGGVTDRRPPVLPEVSGSTPPCAKHPPNEYTDPIKLGGCTQAGPPTREKREVFGDGSTKKNGPTHSHIPYLDLGPETPFSTYPL